MSFFEGISSHSGGMPFFMGWLGLRMCCNFALGLVYIAGAELLTLKAGAIGKFRCGGLKYDIEIYNTKPQVETQ